MIVAVPAATPVTTPVALTVAMVTSEELQLPPVVASANVVAEPAHTVVVPVITLTVVPVPAVIVVVAITDPQLLLTV